MFTKIASWEYFNNIEIRFIDFVLLISVGALYIFVFIYKYKKVLKLSLFLQMLVLDIYFWCMGFL